MVLPTNHRPPTSETRRLFISQVYGTDESDLKRFFTADGYSFGVLVSVDTFEVEFISFDPFLCFCDGVDPLLVKRFQLTVLEFQIFNVIV